MLPLTGFHLPCHLSKCRLLQALLVPYLEVFTVWCISDEAIIMLLCCIGWSMCGLCMVVPCVVAGDVWVHCWYLALCDSLCIVAWDVWPYLRTELLCVFCVWHFCCLRWCLYTLTILSFYSVFFIGSTAFRHHFAMCLVHVWHFISWAVFIRLIILLFL